MPNGEQQTAQQFVNLGSGIGRQLAQLRPADTTAASLYSPPNKTRTKISAIFIANTTGSAATFRLFHDDDGTDVDEPVALYWDLSVAANFTTVVIADILMFNSAGNISVRSGTGNALTFTAYGEETPVA